MASGGGGFRFGGDLIVDDQYVAEVSDDLRALYEEIEDAFLKYRRILYKIKTESISLGETHDAAEAFYEMAETLKGKFDDVAGCADVTLDCFVGEIDNADEYIY